MSLIRRTAFGLIIAGCVVRGVPADTLSEAARRFPQPVRVSDLLSRLVLWPLESQPRVGRVRTVVARLDGTIEIVMDYGGFLGYFTRPVAVPVSALALLGEHMVMLGLTADQLSKIPDFVEAGTSPVATDAIISVALAKPPH